MKTSFVSEVPRLQHEMQYRNYSPKSIKNYCKALTLVENHFQCALLHISQEQFKHFLQHRLVHDRVSTSFINQAIGAYRIYFKDVLGKDLEQFNIKRPRREQKLPTVLSVAEIERLLQTTRNIKHRCVLLLMYSAGLRRSELIQLTPKSIDSERMVVRVSGGKGRKDRETLLSAKALELLRQYFKIYRPKVYLFEPDGSPGCMYGERTVDHIVKNNSLRANIQKNVSCHTLRHSFATHLLEQGVNIRIIQSFLGHNSLKTTSVYLHISNPDARSILSPLDAMKL